MSIGVLVLFVAVLALSVCGGNAQGTTENLQMVFLGRCWDYDVTRYKGLLPRVESDCNDLWRSFFLQGFGFRPPCSLTVDDYSEYFEAAHQELPADKLMFWSGTNELAHRYADNARKHVTLEDTLIGYLVDNLEWCGQVTLPGINFSECPEWGECSVEASESFWAGASIQYAQKARGEVTLLLSGSNPNKPAYRRTDSFFGKYELPNMTSNVTKVLVLLTHELGVPQLENCGTGSLVDLEEDVTSKGFVYECIDDPRDVVHLQCSDNPEAHECAFACTKR